ncbi:MAG: agmatine deiminase family protein [Rhodobacteraceae bacterium]|nr:agmatine deiminase family protein [Paracoccaceae bacterium]
MTTSTMQKVRMPAEWEAHSGCWMGWPIHGMWGKDRDGVEADYAAVAHAVRRFEPVSMLADPSVVQRARNLLGADIDVIEAPMDDAWLRDSGPTFVRTAAGELAGISWRFNGWGGANPSFDKDAALADIVLRQARVPIIPSAMAIEGGAIAVDGAGTLLTTETVVLNPNRNPGMTRAKAEAEFSRTLGVTKVIWLHGNKDEFGTDGHIDGIACFTRPGVVLFEESHERAGRSYETAMANLRGIEGQTDAAGRKIEILRMTDAPPLDRQGKGDWGTSRSYINFYVANDGIVMPSYGVPEDDAARDIIAAAFPGRDIVQVPIPVLCTGGGGIHCITQQQPQV